MTVADSPGVAVPLSILLVGMAAMFGFMTFRPWPGTSGVAGTKDVPISMFAYSVDIFSGKPPAAGVAPGEQDVPYIEAALWVIVIAWVLSKVYSMAMPFLSPGVSEAAPVEGEGEEPVTPEEPAEPVAPEIPPEIPDIPVI